MDIFILFGIALALDLTLGEPPLPLHPVVWMGKIISLLERYGHGLKPSAQFWYGIIIVLMTVALFSVPAYFILAYLKGLNLIVYYIAGALLLKTTFSLKELRQAALRVKTLLVEGKTGPARDKLRALVKRDTKDLPETLVISAAVESVSENTCDSIVAPLFYFVIGGIPAALAYRAVNTLDAMIGYHGRYEYLGKFAARADTVLNFIPARLTALFLVIGAFWSGRDGRTAWHTAITEHSRTASLNAGWPMAACAGALGVQLEKVGHYKLGEPRRLLTPDTIDGAINLMETAMLPCGLLVMLTGAITYVVTR